MMAAMRAESGDVIKLDPDDELVSLELICDTAWNDEVDDECLDNDGLMSGGDLWSTF